MTAFIAAGAGFLLAVVWFDLMFDVQVLGHRPGQLPEPVLASIAGYYRRVTTAARPMNRLIATAMLGTAGALIARGEGPRWVGWSAHVLAGGAITLAAVHTVGGVERTSVRAVAGAALEHAVERQLPEPLRTPEQLERWRLATEDLYRHGMYRGDHK